jgi:hypothetical protein
MKREKQRTMPRSSKRIKLYAELRNALNNVLLYEQGAKLNLRITELPPPRQRQRTPSRRG